MGGFALRFIPSGRSIDCQCPSSPSVNVDAEATRPRQSSSAKGTRDEQMFIDATEEERLQIQSHRLLRSKSLPMQLSHKSHTHQGRFSSISADARIPNVDESAPSRDLPRLPSTIGRYNYQPTKPPGAAEQTLQSESPGKAAADIWHTNRNWNEDRRKFRTRIETTSQYFGDIVWRALKHNETIMAKVLSEPSAEYLARHSKMSVTTTLLTFEGDVWVLTAAQLIEARRRKLIARLPYLTEDEVSDRNKGDLLLKLLALLQVSWMVIQIIARGALHISSTPLEIMTLSFTTCAFLTYTLRLNHPQDVTTSIYVDKTRLCTVDDMRRIADLSPTYYWFTKDRLPCVPNNAIHRSVRETGAVSEVLFNIGLAGGTALFSGAHLVAWNFVFPTVLERTLWRTSSIITLMVPLVTMFVSFRSNILTQQFQVSPMQRSRERWLLGFTGLSTLTLVLARLFVIAEAFRSLYYLPQDAYFATYANLFVRAVNSFQLAACSPSYFLDGGFQALRRHAGRP